MYWIEKCNQDAMRLSKEKRQEYLDLMREGKTVGEATKECGITDDEAVGIITVNIACHKYLRTESV